MSEITTILPPGYLESKERIDTLCCDLLTGLNDIEDRATTLAIALHEEHKKLGEPIHQLIHEVAAKHKTKAKTLSNNMRVMDSAIPFGWFVEGESVTYHNEVHKPELPDVDKLAFLIKRSEHGWTARELRKMVREFMIERGMIEPKEPAKSEVQEALERAWECLRKCKPLITDKEVLEEIDSCLLGQ